ncbi:tetratricopeptide repeat protein [Kibdelosporangium philippinense]|uniref:Tetratricopeptide repeat protein n=2 Tax=Kibdelosporangium philippinense TaxID=211113 RepID=A0ABS8Z393_9PSEU|nr:BTAD domain-containing putative transcriptional regulator [Kibdelosporangium philippinense]MCE7002393.1 tetratricopeptide repeat protein [Kibdelosporangium philippinense]
MRFRVLGPLEVLENAEWQRLGAAKPRLMLAVLLIEANRVVSRDRMADHLWDERPPQTVGNQIHGYAARLRRLLGADRLITQPPGYRLYVEPQDTDLGQFTALAERGRKALGAGDPEAATEALSKALGLWRGTAFEDVPAIPLVAAEVQRLAELRIAAVEDLAQARLDRGEHAQVVTELAEEIAQRPLRERLRELHMLALYRSGRQAEALTAYAELRAALADELGIDPGEPVKQLHERILRSDPTLAPQSHAATVPVHQLPADIPDFSGRAEQLAYVLDTLKSRQDNGPPPIVVMAGGPGVGKSSLAVHAAHTASEGFPDGQIYLELAGTSNQPRDPAVMVAEVLGALGVPGALIPSSLPARASLYRSVLAGRSLLLLLDDAADSSQLRPLLPPTGRCAVMITTRRQLGDLPGARHVELDVLSPAAANRMFTTIVGRDRVDAEPVHADAIVRACGYLPLAIRIVGGKLAGRAHWPLRMLRERLEDESRRLDELRTGDLGVRASFDLSLRTLPADAVQAFAMIGLLGAQSVPAWVLDPLLDRHDTDEILDVLLDANLIRLTGTDALGQPRYRLHDLLRAYAVEAAAAYPEVEAALIRHLATRLWLAEQAAEGLPPGLLRPIPGTSPRRALPKTLTQRLISDPMAWFEGERAAMLEAVALAAERGLDELAWELAAAMVPYYDLRSLHQDWERSHRLALTACTANNPRGTAVLHNGLAQVQIYRDEFDAATDNLRQSLHLAQQAGDRRGEALAIAGQATVARVLGHHDDALNKATRALEIVTTARDRHIEAALRNGIAVIHLAAGRTEDARTWFRDALELSRELDDVHREAVVLREMSQLHRNLGATASALDCLHRAQAIFEQLHDQRCLAYTLLRIGHIQAQQQEPTRTTKTLTRAAGLFEGVGDRADEARCWQLLGELDAEQDDHAAARTHLGRALELWQTFGADPQASAVRQQLHRLSN